MRLQGYVAARRGGLTRTELAHNLGYTIPLGSACFDEVWGHARILCVPYRDWIVAVSGLGFLEVFGFLNAGDPVQQLVTTLGPGSEAALLFSDDTTDTYLFVHHRNGQVVQRVTEHADRLFELNERLATRREHPYDPNRPAEHRFFVETLGISQRRLQPRLMYVPAPVYALP